MDKLKPYLIDITNNNLFQDESLAYYKSRERSKHKNDIEKSNQINALLDTYIEKDEEKLEKVKELGIVDRFYNLLDYLFGIKILELDIISRYLIIFMIFGVNFVILVVVRVKLKMKNKNTKVGNIANTSRTNKPNIPQNNIGKTKNS